LVRHGPIDLGRDPIRRNPRPKWGGPASLRVCLGRHEGSAHGGGGENKVCRNHEGRRREPCARLGRLIFYWIPKKVSRTGPAGPAGADRDTWRAAKTQANIGAARACVQTHEVSGSAKRRFGGGGGAGKLGLRPGGGQRLAFRDHRIAVGAAVGNVSWPGGGDVERALARPPALSARPDEGESTTGSSTKGNVVRVSVAGSPEDLGSGLSGQGAQRRGKKDCDTAGHRPCGVPGRRQYHIAGREWRSQLAGPERVAGNSFSVRGPSPGKQPWLAAVGRKTAVDPGGPLAQFVG